MRKAWFWVRWTMCLGCLEFFVFCAKVGVAAPAVSTDTTEEKDDFVYDSKGKKDPFLPSEPQWTAARTATRLRESMLDGVVWDEANPIAILEGKVLKVGDSYLGARVEKIEKDQAVFSVGNERITVTVAPSRQEDKKDEK